MMDSVAATASTPGIAGVTFDRRAESTGRSSVGAWRAALPCLVVVLMVLGIAVAGSVRAATFTLPSDGDTVVGEVQTHTARHEDTFVALARRYGVGFRELQLANPDVDPWLPGEGTQIVVPTRYVLPEAPRSGIVLNVPEMRLYYFPPAQEDEPLQVMTFPVSVGRQDWSTPYGRTQVTAKQRNPAWYPPQSIREEHAADGRPLPRVVPPGPDNPLGHRALRLGLPGYLIHGTNRPAGVGMRVTHGCVRMFPDDIEALFEMVAVGERVSIVNQPYKMGWLAGELFVEVHPPLEEDEDMSARGLTALVELFVRTTEDAGWQVDWSALDAIHRGQSGIPVALAAEPVELPPAGAEAERTAQAAGP